MSMSYLCRKEAQKTFRWQAALLRSPFWVFVATMGPKIAQPWRKSVQYKTCNCVYQIWRLYIIVGAINEEKLLWASFGCKVGQSVHIGMKHELDMWHHLLNGYTKFQIDISKHVEKKPGKLRKIQNAQKLDMSTACRHLKSPRWLSGTSAHPTKVTVVNIMVMNGWRISFSFLVDRPPIPEIKLFQTRTLKLQGQGHGCGQRARSHSRLNIILAHFLFISHQSDQQFLRYSYFEIWPWNIQGQGHEWGQRSRSYTISSIQRMHFLYVSHQLDQPFLRYGQNIVWPWKYTSEIFNENLPK